MCSDFLRLNGIRGLQVGCLHSSFCWLSLGIQGGIFYLPKYTVLVFEFIGYH
jgi:hypothetical protein